jgi:hypothetical protein
LNYLCNPSELTENEVLFSESALFDSYPIKSLNYSQELSIFNSGEYDFYHSLKRLNLSADCSCYQFFLALKIRKEDNEKQKKNN